MPPPVVLLDLFSMLCRPRPPVLLGSTKYKPSRLRNRGMTGGGGGKSKNTMLPSISTSQYLKFRVRTRLIALGHNPVDIDAGIEYHPMSDKPLTDRGVCC